LLVLGLVLFAVLAACSAETGTPAATPIVTETALAILPTPTAGLLTPAGTDTPVPQCAPPACAPGEVLVCPEEAGCPGGCAVICATTTPAAAVGTAPPATGTPSLLCIAPSCGEAEPVCLSGACADGCGLVCPTPEAAREPDFSGERAYDDLLAQMEFGPRYPGSPGHVAVGDFIAATLEGLGWAVEEQPLTYQGVEGRNFIARGNEGAGPVLIFGAHYDSRAVADQSPGELALEPVPGAVDGASGVAVLFELARVLDLDLIPYEVWLAFFDMEDQGSGGMPGWDWIVGSTYMAENLAVEVEAMVLVDMIGDADQQLYYEGYSDPALRAEIWQVGASLGYGAYFIPQYGYHILDDHRPFLERGIPAVDIIDFDYPYWHTVEDTADKAAPESLERVGRTLEFWLENGR
jgi:glutaminyl-peptide cyclotransferase